MADAKTGPDLRRGIPLANLAEGEALLGHADGEAVLLVRRGDRVHAVGATCTHYGAALCDGLVTGDEIRCPWHHARFSLRTGAATGAPALAALPRYGVWVWQGMVYVLAREDAESRGSAPAAPQRARDGRALVIIGGGAAGHTAAETLRAEGHAGTITLIDADADAPYDRPQLSKDYLAGSASDEWLPLRPPGWYAEHGIDRITAQVTRVSCAARTVTLADRRSVRYDALLLATGAIPVRPPIPGAQQDHVHTLRSLRDCRALIAAVERTRRVVIVGASFVGLEAAAALRTRGADVTVIAPEQVPFARLLGAEVGGMLRALHERHGVRFELGCTVARIDDRELTLGDGRRVRADAVLLATGVRPALDLAVDAGLVVDQGVLVDDYLETSERGVFAAGDIAQFPSVTGARVRIEHWAVAQQQGRAAARNMLGRAQPFTNAPFFWTQHYDVPIAYVGHAARWDRLDIEGSLDAHDCLIRYYDHDEVVAVVTINRDRDSLLAEVILERRHSAPAGAAT